MEKLGQTTAKCSRARSRQNGSQREPCLRHLSPYLKNIHQNRFGGVAEVVEWLLSKHEVLSSNPSMAQKYNKEKDVIDIINWLDTFICRVIHSIKFNLFFIIILLWLLENFKLCRLVYVVHIIFPLDNNNVVLCLKQWHY
jgi:hypothetical protein